VSARETLGRRGTDLTRDAASGASTGGEPAPAHPNRLPTDWWRRNPHYVLYMLREFTAVPIAIWMVWFLVEIGRARGGAAGYHPHMSLAFVIFSVVCLGFAVWHSFTFLRLSGLIVRIPIGERTVPASAIVAGSFGLLLAATVLVGGLLILGGR
jgi:fumarate reductase subunit C